MELVPDPSIRERNYYGRKSGGAFEALPIVPYVSRGEKEFIEIGPQLSAVFGLNPNDVSVRPELWWGRILDADRASCRRIEGRKGPNLELEYRIRDLHGKIRWVSDTRHRTWENGEIIWTGVWRDITYHREVFDRLRQSELQYRQMTENIRDVLWMYDASGNKLIYVSPSFDQVWGRPREKLLSGDLTWAEMIHPEDRDASIEAFERDGKKGILDQEYRIVMPDGEIRWIRDRCFNIRNNALEVYRLAGVAEDITERKRAEDKERELLFSQSRELAKHIRTLELEKEIKQRKKVESALRRSEEGHKEAEKLLRALSSRLIEVQEDERRRMALEIHDELGQLLSVLKMDLEWMKEYHEKKDVGPRLSSASDIVDLTIKTVRRLALELRPAILDDLGLKSALDWQAQRFSSFRVRVHSRFNESRPSGKISTSIFRIVQEALTNVSRHAEAKQVWIRLEENPSGIRLEVVDDGKGMDLDEVQSEKDRIGLVSMRERAFSLGGGFDIESAPGSGTRIKAFFPC